MKLILLSDTHFGVRGDSPIFLDYFSRFFREVFFPYIEANDIKTVVHCGDLVDRRKYLNYATGNTMRREYIERSQQMNLDTHIICGNHDAFHKNNNEVNALREIVMGRPGFTIYTNPATTTFNGLQVLMLPWIAPETYEKSIESLKTKAKICFAHLELVGFEMARGKMMDHGMDSSLFKKFKAVFTGHYHHKSSKGNIHYLGSPYEMTWADYNDPKGFHVFDTETLKLEFIQNPLTLFQKVHIAPENKIIEPATLAGKIVKAIVHEGIQGQDRKDLDQYIAQIEQNAIDVQVMDEHLSTDVETIQIEDVEDTFQLLKEYVMASEFDVDKGALIGLLKELYTECQNQ